MVQFPPNLPALRSSGTARDWKGYFVFYIHGYEEIPNEIVTKNSFKGHSKKRLEAHLKRKMPVMMPRLCGLGSNASPPMTWVGIYVALIVGWHTVLQFGWYSVNNLVGILWYSVRVFGWYFALSILCFSRTSTVEGLFRNSICTLYQMLFLWVKHENWKCLLLKLQDLSY